MYKYGIPYGAKYKTLKRSELYDLVWSEPLRTIAPRFGLSDVWLRKACSRADIPDSYGRYWERFTTASVLVRRPPLPTSTQSAEAEVYLVASGRRAEDLAIDIPEDIANIVAELDALAEPLSMHQTVRLHPLVNAQSRDTRRPSKTDTRRRRILSVVFHQIEKLNGEHRAGRSF